MVHQVQFLLILLLLFVIGIGMLAQRLKVPYPIMLVVCGLLLSFIPGLPRISLDPDLIFLAILPPLLFSAAYETSWREFRSNLFYILSLAFGLVAFTVMGVSFAAHWLIPGFDWRLGLVLGAAIAPTDAIAASAIAKRVGLPQRLVEILEGESLVNDATGLLALEFSTVFVVSGQVPSLGDGLWRFVVLVAGGLLVGLLTAMLVRFIEDHVDDAPLEITISIVTPYLAYMAGEAVHASGVLAVVAAGLYIGHQSSQLFSSRVRIEMHSFWSMLTFLLNAIVFLMIGLQLPEVLQAIQGTTLRELLTSAAELSAAVILLRLLWVFPAARTGEYIKRHWLHRTEAPLTNGGIFVVGWSGMRGVVSLAAALALPAALANGKPFPQRGALLFLVFSVILVTLVLQGLTLPPLIRKLKLPVSKKHVAEESAARQVMLEAALQHLQEMRVNDQPEFDGIYGHLTEFYRRRLGQVKVNRQEPGVNLEAQFRRIAQRAREVERKRAIDLRNKQEIGDQVLRTLERELDLLDVRFPKGNDAG